LPRFAQPPEKFRDFCRWNRCRCEIRWNRRVDVERVVVVA
jgi:hypothetical protein